MQVVQCQFHDGPPGENEIHEILGNPRSLISIEHAVWLVQNLSCDESARYILLLGILRIKPDKTMPPLTQTAVCRMREAAAIRLMASTTQTSTLRMAILDFLGEQRISDSKELTDFLWLCLHLEPSQLNPIASIKATVVQWKFSLLTRDVLPERASTWTAIPFLWQLVTTLADGKRITLAEAFRLRHKLHAASTLLALYAQTPYADPSLQPNPLWRFDGILVRPATPETDAQLIEWFHRPYLQPSS